MVLTISFILSWFEYRFLRLLTVSSVIGQCVLQTSDLFLFCQWSQVHVFDFFHLVLIRVQIFQIVNCAQRRCVLQILDLFLFCQCSQVQVFDFFQSVLFAWKIINSVIREIQHLFSFLISFKALRFFLNLVVVTINSMNKSNR